MSISISYTSLQFAPITLKVSAQNHTSKLTPTPKEEKKEVDVPIIIEDLSVTVEDSIAFLSDHIRNNVEYEGEQKICKLPSSITYNELLFLKKALEYIEASFRELRGGSLNKPLSEALEEYEQERKDTPHSFACILAHSSHFTDEEWQLLFKIAFILNIPLMRDATLIYVTENVKNEFKAQ